MSIASPIISRWIQRKYEWIWTFEPKVNTFPIPANQRLQIPNDKATFAAEEGTVLYMTATFDSMDGGIVIETDEGYDRKVADSIRNYVNLGQVTPNNMIYAAIPPTTPVGRFVLIQMKEIPWTKTCRLYVFNNSNVTINCLGYTYIVAYLKQKKPFELEEVQRLKVFYDMFPNRQATIKNILEKEAIKNLGE